MSIETDTKVMELCPDCDDGEGGCAYPFYGVAPHQCFYKIPGASVGESRELPESAWPANFRLDQDAGPPAGYPRAGIYTHCLSCGSGEPAQEAQG